MPTRGELVELAGDLRQELEALERIADEVDGALLLADRREPTRLELRGMGDLVHDSYNAVERCLERVSVDLNGSVPGGPDSHVRLLDRMARELPGLRPAVLRPETRQALGEYLRFRHLFRHRYGFELSWGKLEPLLRGLTELVPEVHADLEGFAGTVTGLAERLE